GYSHWDDGIHPGPIGAYWMGYAAWQAIRDAPSQFRKCRNYSDYFRTKANRTESLLSRQSGIFAGIAGTKIDRGNFNSRGYLATGWTLDCNVTNASTTSCIISKESMRSGLPSSGERQRLVFSNTVAGGESELYYLYQTVSRNLAVGDIVQFEL